MCISCYLKDHGWDYWQLSNEDTLNSKATKQKALTLLHNYLTDFGPHFLDDLICRMQDMVPDYKRSNILIKRTFEEYLEKMFASTTLIKHGIRREKAGQLLERHLRGKKADALQINKSYSIDNPPSGIPLEVDPSLTDILYTTPSSLKKFIDNSELQLCTLITITVPDIAKREPRHGRGYVAP